MINKIRYCYLIVLIILCGLFVACTNNNFKQNQYSISGIITDQAGNGIADVKIKFRNVLNKGMSVDLGTVTTDKDGKFTKNNLKRKVKITPLKEGYFFRSKEVTEEDRINFSDKNPTAKDDQINVIKGKTVSIDVLNNDIDSDKSELKISKITDPNFGNAKIKEGQINYTYPLELTGTKEDSFTYTIQNKWGATAIAKVIIIAKENNNKPIIESVTNVSDGLASVNEGEELVLEVKVASADQNSLKYSISGADADKFSQNKNIFTWVPIYGNYSSNNTYQITLEVSNELDTATLDVEITIRDDTTAPAGYSVSIDQSTINTTNQTAMSFRLANAEKGIDYNYRVSNTNESNNLSGSGVVSATDQQITGIDVSSLADGELVLKLSLVDGAANEGKLTTAKVNKETILPNWITAPKITTAATTNSVGISAKVDEDANIYYQVLADGTTSPTASDIKSNGNSVAFTAGQLQEIMIDNLDSGIDHDLFFVVEDSFGNLQLSVKKVDVSTRTSKALNPELVPVTAGTTSVDNANLTLDYAVQVGKYEVTHAEFIEFLNSIDITADGVYKGQELIDLDDSDCATSYDGNNFYFTVTSVIESKETPIIEITWYGAVAYCNWLSKQQGLAEVYDLSSWELKSSDESTLEGYRLPTMAEREYIARGGANGIATSYSGSDSLDEVGWYSNNSNDRLRAVGEKVANELGIYDMSGNVWEWTNTYEDSYIISGGGWSEGAEYSQVNSGFYGKASRSSHNLGFRIIRTD